MELQVLRKSATVARALRHETDRIIHFRSPYQLRKRGLRRRERFWKPLDLLCHMMILARENEITHWFRHHDGVIPSGGERPGSLPGPQNDEPGLSNRFW
jgi:hypothetical protein